MHDRYLSDRYAACMALPQEAIDTTMRWMDQFVREWHGDIPQKIHVTAIDAGGAPEWHPEFRRWLAQSMRVSGSGHNPPNKDSRNRVTRAMRLVRKMAIREYEVAYRIMVLGDTIEGTTNWLNERAIRNDVSDRYNEQDTAVILFAAMHKVQTFY